MEDKVILLNGPPNAGKDLAAIYLSNYLASYGFKVATMKFADPLKQAAHALYNIPHSTAYYEKEFGNDWKNQPQQEFFQKTPREIYIALSESFAKVINGEDFFGRIAARRISLERDRNLFIFTDSGFASEAVPVIKRVGIQNVLLLEIDRNGTSFASDSRSYIGDDLVKSFPNLARVRIPNHQGKDIYRVLIRAAAAQWLGIVEE